MKKKLHLIFTFFAIVLFLASGVHVTLSKCHSDEIFSDVPACCSEQCGDEGEQCNTTGFSGETCCTFQEASFFVPVYGIDKVNVPDPASGVLPDVFHYFTVASVVGEVSFSAFPALNGEPPATTISQLGVYRI